MNALASSWLAFEAPPWLWGLPLALLPWLNAQVAPWPALRFSSLAVLPADPTSRWMAWALRAAGSLALAGLVLALARPYRPSYEVERQGHGAEIVLLLDRSRSMDQSLMSSAGPLAKFTPNYSVASDHTAEERMSKSEIARRALADFAARRHDDRFAMLMFSTMPLKVLDFTQKPAAIQAAIEAGAVGRGVANTDIGQALLAGLTLFEHRAYTGSRVLMLVSDGGDHLEPAVRDRVASLLRQHRVSLVWVYIRSPLGPKLLDDLASPANAAAEPGAQAVADAADTVPEYFLHRFFRSLSTPYRAYEADNPDALRRAVADVDRLENLPITYADTVPRRELDTFCLLVALAAVAGLLLARRTALPAWR